MDTTLTDPLVGRLLDARYRVESRVARGGMASVYTATDTRLDRLVAVKVMHPGLADDDEFVARFIREAKAAARLSHPNVVSVFDQGRDDGVVFLVMEYVAGRTLRDLLHARGRLPVGQALAVVEPVLAALAAAHDAGLVHRDIKPENVLLADDGRVKVADFGLARAVAGATLTSTTGLLIGTVAYLAPEQVERGVADARTDVYATGVMLFELLTGSPPYTGETSMSVAYRHVNDDVPPPSRRAPGIPPEVDALVGAATRRDPDRRPRDAAAMLAGVVALRHDLGLRDGVPTVPGGADTLVVRRDGQPTEQVYRGGQVTERVPHDAGAAADPWAPPARRRRRRWPWTLLLAAVVIAAALVGWWYGALRYVSAPGLLGLTPAAAAQRAAAVHLHTRVGSGVWNDVVPEGRVAGQDPGPSGSVLRGGTVLLHLSQGPERHAVPDVTGSTLAAARAALATAKLDFAGTRPAFSDTIPAGRVVSSDPAAGTVLRHGTGVHLLVSRGKQPVRIPDVRNASTKAATSTLTGLGLQVTVTQAYSDTVDKDHVISTSPAGGSTVAKGSRVTLTVSKGPQLFPVPDTTGMNADQAVRILHRAGFSPQVTVVLPFGPGQVLRQSPRGKAPHGATITLYVF